MWRVGVATVVLMLAVAGCTSDGDPAPSSAAVSSASTSVPVTSAAAPTTSSSSPSPSVATTGPNVRPGEKPPVLPGLGRTNSRPGAAVFASYWLSALDWSYATGDTTLVKSLYLSSCRTCATVFVGPLDEVRAKGQKFLGGRVSPNSRRLVSSDETYPSSTVVDVNFDIGAAKIVGPDARVVRSGPKITNLDWRTWLTWRDGAWRVLDFKRVSDQ